MSSLSQGSMVPGIPFLESNYQMSDGFNVVLKKDPTGQKYDIFKSSAMYYPDEQGRPAVVLKDQTPEFSMDTYKSKAWQMDDRVAWHNMKTCANRLESIVLPVIDIQRNPKKTPPSAELRQNIANWKMLANKFVSTVDSLPIDKTKVEQNTINFCKETIAQANRALELGIKTQEPQLRSPKVIAATVILLMATIGIGYLATRRPAE